MILLQRPGQPNIEIECLLIDYEGSLAIDGRVHPKVKDKINLLSKRLKIYIFVKGEKEKVEERLRNVKANIVFLQEGQATVAKLELLKKVGPERTVAIGNGVDDVSLLEEAIFSIGVIGKEGASGEALKKADLVVTDVINGLDFLLKPLRQKTTLGR